MVIIGRSDAAFFMTEYPRDRKARHFQFSQIGADRAVDVVQPLIGDTAHLV